MRPVLISNCRQPSDWRKGDMDYNNLIGIDCPMANGRFILLAPKDLTDRELKLCKKFIKIWLKNYPKLNLKEAER